MVNVVVDSVTADANSVATVNFTVKDTANAPVTTVASVSAGIFKLAPKGGGLIYNKWASYIWRVETVSGATFPKPDGTKANRAYRESSGTGVANGTLVKNGGGSYTYSLTVHREIFAQLASGHCEAHVLRGNPSLFNAL